MISELLERLFTRTSPSRTTAKERLKLVLARSHGPDTANFGQSAARYFRSGLPLCGARNGGASGFPRVGSADNGPDCQFTD